MAIECNCRPVAHLLPCTISQQPLKLPITGNDCHMTITNPIFLVVSHSQHSNCVHLLSSFTYRHLTAFSKLQTWFIASIKTYPSHASVNRSGSKKASKTKLVRDVLICYSNINSNYKFCSIPCAFFFSLSLFPTMILSVTLKILCITDLLIIK